MPDSLSLFSQLGKAPPTARWKVPTQDCHQLFDWKTGHINSDLRPVVEAETKSIEKSGFMKDRLKLRSHTWFGWQLFLTQLARL